MILGGGEWLYPVGPHDFDFDSFSKILRDLDWGLRQLGILQNSDRCETRSRRHCTTVGTATRELAASVRESRAENIAWEVLGDIWEPGN